MGHTDTVRYHRRTSTDMPYLDGLKVRSHAGVVEVVEKDEREPYTNRRRTIHEFIEGGGGGEAWLQR